MATETHVRRLLVLQSAKIDRNACDKGVVVFQVAKMATEVGVRKLPGLQSANIDTEFLHYRNHQ